jgi:hypothetical protein
MPRTILALLALTAALTSGPAAAQTHAPGCDITTSSYAVIDPPSRRKTAGPIVAMPQTPCATIPNGYEDVLLGVTVDVNRGDPRLQTPQAPETPQAPQTPQTPRTRPSQR